MMPDEQGAQSAKIDVCVPTTSVPASSTERSRLNKAVRDFDGKVILEVTHVSYMLPAEVGGQQFA